MQVFVNLLIFTLVLVIYTIFIWKFYLIISTRDILRLNLSKYNKSTHPLLTKIIAGTLYFLEYIIILPFLIFFWFALFTTLLTLISEGVELKNIIFIAAITISAIRIISYWPKYGELIAGDLAKEVPISALVALLIIGATTSSFFSLESLINKITKIPFVINEIKLYIFFIIVLELILRCLTFLVSMFEKKGGTELKEDVD